MITLQEITFETVVAVTELSVTEDQTPYVASNAVSIAEAYFNPGAWFRAVYCDGDPVGFVMLFDSAIPGAIASDPIAPTEMFLWRLMIDKRYQGRGFGRKTLELVRDHAIGLNRRRLLSSYVPGPSGPEQFYLSHGFSKTGRLMNDGREIEIALVL